MRAFFLGRLEFVCGSGPLGLGFWVLGFRDLGFRV